MRQIKITSDTILAQLQELHKRSVCNQQAYKMEFPEGTPSEDKIKYWRSVIDSTCSINYLKEFIKSNIAQELNLSLDKIHYMDPSGFICYEE